MLLWEVVTQKLIRGDQCKHNHLEHKREKGKR